MDAAVVAALAVPLDAPHGPAVVTFVTATAAAAFVVGVLLRRVGLCCGLA